MTAPAGGLPSLLRDVAAFARWRLVRIAALALAAAFAEGAGVLLLVPLLHFLGVDGSGGGAPSLPPVSLEAALALYVAIVAAAALTLAARANAMAALHGDYTDALRRRLHHALMNMDFAAFSRLRAADIQHATIMETIRAAHGVEHLLRLASGMVEVAVLLAVALRLSPPLTAAALVLGALCVVLARPLGRHAHAAGQRQIKAGRDLHAALNDDLAGMRVIRGLGMEAVRHHYFAMRNASLQAAHLAFQRMASLSRAAALTLAAAAAAVAVWLALRVLHLPLAETLALMAAFARLLTAGLRLQEAWRTVVNALPAHAAVHALETSFLAAAEPAADHTAATAPQAFSRLELRDASFSYGGDAAAVDGISVCIPGRAMTALIGPSGAGKSTLADLLLGLLAPTRGSLTIDGQSLDGTARRAWRCRVGYVPQDAFLFHDSVRANLAVAAPKASEAEMWTALEQASAAEFVRALPQGLDTVVGDRGSLLSGGERQRLALARVLLTDCALLILDEATNALDSDSERRVMAALEALRGRMALVVVAHRASSVRMADHVVVLEAGRLVAAGTWAEVGAVAAPLLERLTMGTA